MRKEGNILGVCKITAMIIFGEEFDEDSFTATRVCYIGSPTGLLPDT